MQIENLDSKDKVIIVAEIGNNHEGDYKIAKELVIQAAKTGVDAVKFQTFKVSEFLSNKSDRYNFYKKMSIKALRQSK